MKRTLDIGIEFDRNIQKESKVIGYVGADFARDLDERRSTTGYLFYFGRWDQLVGSQWAKYMTTSEAVKEAMWLRGLIGELG